MKHYIAVGGGFALGYLAAFIWQWLKVEWRTWRLRRKG